MKLKFSDIDNNSKLPKELNFIIFEYTTYNCFNCMSIQKKCDTCKDYYCICDKNYKICFICKNLLCHQKININKNEVILCDLCWEIDNFYDNYEYWD